MQASQIVELMALGASLSFGFLFFSQFRDHAFLPQERRIQEDIRAFAEIPTERFQSSGELMASREELRDLSHFMNRSRAIIARMDLAFCGVCIIGGLICSYFIASAAFGPARVLSDREVTIAIAANFGWILFLLVNAIYYSVIAFHVANRRREILAPLNN
jgi:hypothetical protein